MARRSLLGHKVRKLRREKGLSQVAMAERLGISPSYLNLIEHNQRSLTLPLVLKISRLFEIDLQTFSDEEELRLVARLEEVFGDTLFREAPLDSAEIQDIVGAHPELCRALVTLYHAYRGTSDTVHVLKESLSGETFLSTSTHKLLTLLTSIRSFSEILHDNRDLGPVERERFLAIIVQESDGLASLVGEMLEYGQSDGLKGLQGANTPTEEVTDLFEENDNFFPEVEEAAASFRRETGLGDEVTAGRLVDHLEQRLEIRTQLAPASELGAEGRHYDADDRRLLLSDALPLASLRFQVARQIGSVVGADAFAPYASGPVLTTDASRSLCLDALAKYFGAAVLMPYDSFREAARSLRHDIELLQNRFGASFEQVCHRLTSLRRPGAAGIPFHFVRVDIAGNISKRFSGAGMRIPRFGGACPRWNVHAAFTSPGTIRTQLEQLPDGTRYLSLAQSEVKRGGGHHVPKSHLAVSIGCEDSYAGQIVYADGLTLEATDAVMPIGVTCRLCERDDCIQRAFPPFVEKSGFSLEAEAGRA
ncbi:MAG: short-chain fatty acyl-CoA regulator family protein [Alphaproteobacteria bacterium]|nr:short-chain fatty acyl-CoA regulator family protein [Alphaproteobacteria bacterium]